MELLGTRSNLLLLDERQTILGVARPPKTVPAAGQRLLLPNRAYQPPPAQQKRLPTELTELALREELAEASPEMPLARLLPQIASGLSPLLAQEITFRATGRADTPVGEIKHLAPLREAIAGLFALLESESWQPTLAVDDDDQPTAFAPYPLTHLPHLRPIETISEAVELYFADAAAGYAAAKIPWQEAITAARHKLERRREKLQEDAADMANPTAFKEYGEMILASAHLVKPRQTELLVDWMPDESPTRIKLDPALSPSENAQHYFHRYRKAQRAAGEIPAQLEKIELESAYLEQLEQDLDMAENRPEIEAVAAALTEAGYHQAKTGGKIKPQRAAANYLRLTAPDGATVWVGKNALQNAQLTFHRAKPDDLWLHARQTPGAHVIIPTAQGLPSEEDVLWAAAVAAYYSRRRNDAAVEVDVTPKKHVRAIKGAPPGLVTYRQAATLRVSPAAPDLD